MIAVTGANGYVGGRILQHLRTSGHAALALVRKPGADQGAERRFALGQPLQPGVLDGVETVVHAAWDLSCRGARVHAVNCEGSLPLIDAVAARGGRVVLISSLSAFAGARSDYGRAKLELERAVLETGGVAVRPGLVFGVGAGGLFESMSGELSGGAPVPMIGGGRQRLFVTHDVALCELIEALIAGGRDRRRVLFAAHEVPTSLRAVALELARARGIRLRVMPVPAGLAYAALRALELAGVPTPYRSDSVRSLVNPIPLDQVAALERGPVVFPALSPELWRA